MQPNIKKYLDRFNSRSSDYSLIAEMRDLIYISIYKLYQLQLWNTFPVNIYALPQWAENQNHQLENNLKYSVFACSKQRNQQLFQHMNPEQQQELLETLKSDYRHILVNYFVPDKTLKEKIDKFINSLFYANIPVPQIIEIHMELIDEFSKQLRLEGRSDETLQDYRLTLIDILAHLCESYRCSIAKIN
nr:KaiA family protein [Richelia sinica]